VNRHQHGRRAAIVALLAALSMLLAPAGASAFSKAIWGSLTYNGISQFPLYRQLGVKIYQTTLSWAQVAPRRPSRPTNPNDPAYHWPTDISLAVIQAQAFHMRVLLQIDGAPSWANGGHTNSAWAPRKPQDFANFATASAKRYPAVKLWMIWGEPTRKGNFYPIKMALPGETLSGAQLTAPHRYAQMLDAAYGALKAVRSSNVVIGGSTYTTGVVDPLQWIANLKLPNGRPPRMDMYAHNPFTYQQPSFTAAASPFDEVQFSDLHELAGWIDKYLRRGLALFLSEFTIPTAADAEFNFYVDPAVAGQWVADILHLSRSYQRIYALGWVNVYDAPPRSYGGLLTQSGQPKPSFYAFEHG
jgi:hypothetical protein